MSTTSGVGVVDLFYLLESNKLVDVEEIKKVFHDHFLSTKDNWLVNGLFDYYLSTDSLRAVEVLAGVREPHDRHLLDRLTEALAKPGGQGHRVQALTVLSHVIRRQPTWLYKLANHSLFRELLKLLKAEADGDMPALMGALLLLVMLLPMLPAYLGSYLNEIFEVFGRLAYFHYHRASSLPSRSPSSLSSVSCPTGTDRDRLYLLHLQVGLYSLFHRLYAMYPCNFVSYLRQQYAQREQLATFSHTVRPMLDSVRMHPLLVTASKDAETSASRWKKMEHHDVVAECGRFALERAREDALTRVALNQRFTPILDSAYAYEPMSSGGLSTMGVNNREEEGFWSPSMVMPSHSPPLQATPHEPRSTPSTPNSNRIGTSPPEAAVEATPETTPVKDLRQLGLRQAPVGSGAVRSLSALGNGSLGPGDSRPSTPTPTLVIAKPLCLPQMGSVSSSDSTANSHAILSQKIGKLLAERQTVLHSQTSSTSTDLELGKVEGRRGRETEVEDDLSQNGRNDSWREDQEVLEIVGSQSGNYSGSRGRDGARVSVDQERVSREASNDDECPQGALADLSQKVQRLRYYSQCQTSSTHSSQKVHKANSCPEIKAKKSLLSEYAEGGDQHKEREEITERKTEEIGTQTQGLVPYEHLLLGVLSQGASSTESTTSASDSRLSPSTMLDRYVQACARSTNHCSDILKPKATTTKQKHKKKGTEDDGVDDTGDDDAVGFVQADLEGGNQQLQLMQMQLQFERQRREVHAERNRRLLGKLRESRALEEHNSTLRDRLRMAEKEMEGLRGELERSKREARLAEERHTEALLYWQSQCAEEQRQCRTLRTLVETLELEVKNERERVTRGVRETRAAEGALFDAAHQLKGALKAANRGELLKHTLDTLQKRFLLLGEAQLKLRERTGGPTPMARQEAAQIQKAYAEELSSIRRQLESRSSLVEALRARLSELEGGEVRRETQLAEQQRLLQEAKERHEAELEALESKYRSQRIINLRLEGRILELLGALEAVNTTSNSSASMVGMSTSVSPKERSPPLSTSLASSSEGSLAFIHHQTGIMMNDCCDSAGEITNLQAIVDPGPSLAASPNPTPSHSSLQQNPKQD